MYSQNNEEEIIVRYFGTQKGSFLDIGAYDGKKFSNIHRLCELGWNGVCIEPSPNVFVNLIKNMRQFPGMKLVNAAISPVSEIKKFYDSGGDAISSFDFNHKTKWENGFNSKFQEVWIKTITFQEILKTFGTNFQFINIDVEATNFELFTELMKYLPSLSSLKMLCIEHDNSHGIIETEMSRHGFKKLLFNGENLIMAK